MTGHSPSMPLDLADETGFRLAPEEHCFIVFVGGEPFGLPVDQVQTIFQIETITPVPLGPREVLGLVNLRGKIVTAVSLRQRLHAQDMRPERARLAIGIEHRGENFALVVDEVGDVITLDPGRRIPMPPHLDARRAKLTQAVYALESQILSLLDMNALFEFQRRT